LLSDCEFQASLYNIHMSSRLQFFYRFNKIAGKGGASFYASLITSFYQYGRSETKLFIPDPSPSIRLITDSDPTFQIISDLDPTLSVISDLDPDTFRVFGSDVFNFNFQKGNICYMFLYKFLSPHRNPTDSNLALTKVSDPGGFGSATQLFIKYFLYIVEFHYD